MRNCIFVLIFLVAFATRGLGQECGKSCILGTGDLVITGQGVEGATLEVTYTVNGDTLIGGGIDLLGETITIDCFSSSDEITIVDVTASDPNPGGSGATGRAWIYNIPIPSVSVIEPSPICPGDEITLVAETEDSVSYLWSTGNETNQVTLQPDSSSITISVVVTNTFGCSDTAVVEVEIADLYITAIAPLEPICSGADFLLQSQSTGSLTIWTAPDGTVYEGENLTLIATPELSGMWQITTENEFGCIATDSLEVVINIPPRLILSDVQVCEGEEIVLKPEWVEAESSLSFQWWFEDWLISTGDSVIIDENGTLPDPFGAYPAEGSYSLIVTDSVGCVREKSLEVDLHLCCESLDSIRSIIYFPNAFSPNNDGINDCFRGFLNPQLEAEINSYRFLIFDRWGNLVFKGEESDSWDGLFRGRAMDQAVFAWFAEIITRDGCRIFRKGGVQLIR